MNPQTSPTIWTTKHAKAYLYAGWQSDANKEFFGTAFWHIFRAHQNAYSLQLALRTHNIFFHYILESRFSVVVCEHSKDDPNFKPQAFARVEFYK